MCASLSSSTQQRGEASLCCLTIACTLLQAGVSRVHSLAPIPHQGPLVASGAAEGAVLLWDLRFVQQPVVCTEAHPGAGDVWQVRHTDMLLM